MADYLKKIRGDVVNRSWRVGIFFMAMVFVACAGCTAPAGTINTSENETIAPGTIASSYVATLNQPNAQSAFIKMDTDIYNIGEVVEFTVTNGGSGTLSCTSDPPSFAVHFQTPGGMWATRMETEEPNGTARSSLASGESTRRYGFVTTGWEPGRYRIVHDCGVEREILVRAMPTLAPTPAPCPVQNASTEIPWITIDPISDTRISTAFGIRGSTNLPAGEELRFVILPASNGDPSQPAEKVDYFTTLVLEGTCGNNTWSADGEIQVTGEFVIWISDIGRNTTAIKRFSVLS